MSRAFFAVCVALVAMVAVPAAEAGPAATKSYTIASTPIVSVSCAPCGLEEVNIGGVNFETTGTQPLTVSISDVLQGAVSFTVCQNFDGDNLCGEADPITGEPLEPNLVTCGTTAALGPEFDAAFEVQVFIRLYEPGCGNALTGTVTVEYADA